MTRIQNREPVWIHLFFLLPATIVFCLVIVIPFFTGVGYSFTDWNGISNRMSFTGLTNYKNLFTGTFLQTFWFTLRFAVWEVVLVLVIGTVLAAVLVQALKFRDLFRVLFYLPQTMGGLILGFIWQFIFITGFPAIGKLLHIPFLQLPWLGTEQTAFAGLVIVSTWQNVGYVMIIMTAALTGIPAPITESAEIDGAGYLKTFFLIKLPMCMPFVTVSMFWTTANAFKMFELNMSLTKGGPYGSTVSLALGIYNDAFTRNQYGLATAESIIFFLIIMIITALQLVLTRRKEVAAYE